MKLFHPTTSSEVASSDDSEKIADFVPNSAGQYVLMVQTSAPTTTLDLALKSAPISSLKGTNLLAVEGVLRNQNGSSAEAGLEVTVTVGDNPPQNAFTEGNGHYTATFFNPTGTIANVGDTVSARVSRPTTGESAIDTFVLTSQEIDDQRVTIDLSFRGESEFDLTFPKGIGLIHIPLKVTEVDGKAMKIETIGDLYDTLGSDNVNFIITRDAEAGVWRSYLGETSRGTSADTKITDDMGIITVMKTPVTLRLKGDALGTDGVSQITLNPGTNLVGVPLMDERLQRVSDLLSLEGIKDNATVIIVSDEGTFKVVARASDDGDIDITGGQSFIITARAAGLAEVTGEAWDNVLDGTPAAPLMALVGHEVNGQTPVLVTHGTVVGEVTGAAKEGFRVTVKNLSTGATLQTLSGRDTPFGRYSVTFVDLTSSRAAQVGDVLAITVQTPTPGIGVQPLRHIISTEDVKASQIRLPDLVTYEIPTETKLLPNYPNPFNPETWIAYRLAEDATVTLTIYDMTGSVVRTLTVGHQPAAVYESKQKAIYWNGRNDSGERVSSGVYFYHFQAGDYHATRKMIVLK